MSGIGVRRCSLDVVAAAAALVAVAEEAVFVIGRRRAGDDSTDDGMMTALSSSSSSNSLELLADWLTDAQSADNLLTVTHVHTLYQSTELKI